MIPSQPFNRKIAPIRPHPPALLVPLLGGLTALDAMSIDIYIPATPQLQAAFQADAAQIQSAMSAFLIGIVGGQILWGPLSDRLGRRGPLLAGLVLFCLSSLLCLSARDVDTFIVARVLQAIGASAGLVIARAVVRDIYKSVESARVYALLMQVLGVTSIVSPLVGGGLLLIGSWRLIFLVLLLIGVCFLAGAFAWLPETLSPQARSTSGARDIGAAAANLVRSWAFVAPTLVGALTLAGMFAILTGSAYFFVGTLGWTPLAYAVFYGFTGFVFIGSCRLNVALLQRSNPRTICNWGLLAQFVFAGLLVFTFLAAKTGGGWVALLMTCLMALLGFILSNATAIAMNASGAYSGVASSLVGIVHFSMSTAVVPLVTLPPQVGFGMSVTLFACAVGAALFGFTSSRQGNVFH